MLRTCGLMEGFLGHALFDVGLLADDRIAVSPSSEDGWLHSSVSLEQCRDSIGRAFQAWALVPGGREIVESAVRDRFHELGGRSEALSAAGAER